LDRGEKLTTVLRNKLSSTLAYLFIDSYPNNIPTFLHPFFELLSPQDPQSSKSPNLHPILLAVRLLIEIAQEVHDSVIKSARSFTDGRHARDGFIRDSIRSSGDERLAVDGLVGLVETSLGVVEMGGDGSQKWVETADLALKALGAWIRKLPLSIRIQADT
jgi:exportin-T